MILMGLMIQQAVAQETIAMLPDGNHQFCSKPQQQQEPSAAGICFNFIKIGDRLDGYYAYPYTDELICLRGQINGHMVQGKALAISWPGHAWETIPKTEFRWDTEGRLMLSGGQIVRTDTDRSGRTDWISFRYAALNTQGFYQYHNSLLTSPAQLCKWPP
jgi:hypothetical protein